MAGPPACPWVGGVCFYMRTNTYMHHFIPSAFHRKSATTQNGFQYIFSFLNWQNRVLSGCFIIFPFPSSPRGKRVYSESSFIFESGLNMSLISYVQGYHKLLIYQLSFTMFSPLNYRQYIFLYEVTKSHQH